MEEKIRELFSIVIDDYERGEYNYNEAVMACEMLNESCDDTQKKYWIEELFACMQRNPRWENGKCKYAYIYSLVFLIELDAEYVLEFTKLILADEKLTWQNLHFLYYRLLRIMFINPKAGCIETGELLWQLLEKTLEKCKNENNYNLDRIPEEELNGDTQIILISQFLAPEHGPTKTAMDRASVMSQFGKVLIINTAELLSLVGAVPYMCDFFSEYREDILDLETVEWKGKVFDYFQCEQNMPDAETMGIILNFIRDLKPKMCVCVGGASLFAGLVNEMIPTLTVATTQSGIVQTLCDYQIANRYQIESDRKRIEEHDYMKHIIEGLFTFSIKEQQEEFSRKEINIADDSFVISIVGARLTLEMRDDIWTVLELLANENIKVILIGGHDKLDAVMKRHPALEDIVINLGFCKDAISRIGISDLYLNPIRRGGATSAVEAMSIAVPVLTVNYGDVAGTVGEEFVCDSVEEFPDMIRKYIYDDDYRNTQKEIALARAKILLDSDSEFTRELMEYLERRKRDYLKQKM